MPVEIEHKFLLKNDNWRQHIQQSSRIRQAYLGTMTQASVRVRIEGSKANINIKSAGLSLRRMEYEYAIPLDEAHEMLDQLCGCSQSWSNISLASASGIAYSYSMRRSDKPALLILILALLPSIRTRTDA